jgi:hypothetical protein
MPRKLSLVRNDDASEISCATAIEFNHLIVCELYKVVANWEKKAFETQKTVTFGFSVERDGGKTLAEFRFVCEPGKPARRIK